MRKIFTTLLALLLTAVAFCQSPEKISYQAVIRDTDNSLLSSQPVGMQISILSGTISGLPVYVEIHNAETNENGLLCIKIGEGVVQMGDFSTIDWANGPYYIKTETDPAGGTNYSITGTSQLLSVPYALHAKTAGSFAETDPEFGASEAFNITSSDIINLGNLTGINTGDQDLGSYAPQAVLVDTASALRSVLEDSAAALRSGMPRSPWSTSGNNVYLNSGLLGIGQNSPNAMLDIYDNIGYTFLNFLSEDNVYTQWTSNRLGADDFQIGLDGGNNKFSFANRTRGSYPLVIHEDNIGLCNLYPEARLDISVDGESVQKLLQFSTENGASTIASFVYEGTNPYHPLILDLKSNYKSPGVFSFWGGKVGVGTYEPDAPLHINDLMKLEPRSTTPESPSAGMIYYDNRDNKLKVFTGKFWEDLN